MSPDEESEMIGIRQAVMPEDRDAVYELFAEYLRWVCPRILEEYGVVFDAESILVRDMGNVNIYMPPQGLLLLAWENASLAGCACARQNDAKIAELKRMYVRPSFRGKGIGRRLVTESIQAARQAGISILRLDSAGFMLNAHNLYRSFGFEERSPYEGSEIPPEHSRHWVYMELALGEQGTR
jgi:GNAT superfamily N-acetyltransferase